MYYQCCHVCCFTAVNVSTWLIQWMQDRIPYRDNRRVVCDCASNDLISNTCQYLFKRKCHVIYKVVRSSLKVDIPESAHIYLFS